MSISFPEFPNSAREPFLRTSPFSSRYNCLAWAAGDATQWYEPDPFGVYYWPNVVPRDYSISSCVKLFEFLGFVRCSQGDFERGFEKVAIFSSDGQRGSHAARQLNEKWWSSKLGCDIDVSHTLTAIENGAYGAIYQFLRRPVV